MYVLPFILFPYVTFLDAHTIAFSIIICVYFLDSAQKNNSCTILVSAVSISFLHEYMLLYRIVRLFYTP